jgi:hypothetical protein
MTQSVEISEVFRTPPIKAKWVRYARAIRGVLGSAK